MHQQACVVVVSLTTHQRRYIYLVARHTDSTGYTGGIPFGVWLLEGDDDE